VGDLICFLLLLVIYLIIAWVILSYIAGYGRLPWGHPVRRIYDGIDRGLQPVLGPLRRVLPPLRLGSVALDLSPIVLLLGISLVRSFIC
jgi:YggT family protein